MSGITGVELATVGNLIIELGEQEKLTIEAEDNLLRYIETEVRGGTLRIETRDGVSLNSRRPVTYYLTVQELDEIVISSSGDVKAPDLEVERLAVTISSSGDLQMGDLKADTLEVRITSSGDMELGELYANRLEVLISSSGNLDIAGGEVEMQVITISSSGEYQAEDLESGEAEVHLTSNGSATVWVRDYLKANLSSSGDLLYGGSPTLDVTTSSSGDVDKISD